MIKLNDLDLDKTTFVEHCDCDGLVPYILNKFFNINYAKSISTNYNEDLELEFVQSGLYENIVYVDFTPSETIRNIIKEKQMNIMIFDHHIAIKEEIEQFVKDYGEDKVTYIFDNERCGTKIYYDYLMENNYKDKTNFVVEHIVNLTDTYDLYKQNSELWSEAESLNRLLYCTGKFYIKDDRFKCFEFFINNMLWKMQNADHFFFNSLEQSKINADISKENQLFEGLVNNALKEISTRKDEKGLYFAVFHCNSKISAICNRLLAKYKKLTYVICINNYDKENPKISLRSREGFNLLNLKFCKGHENACGVSEEEVECMKEFVKKLENKEIYELGYKEN